MHTFVVASNVGRESVKVSFRDAIARDAAGDAAKYGKHNSKRRDILSRSMVLPSLLKREQPGRPRVFQASRVVLVDGRGARRLDCGLATSTVVCRLKSKPAILELAILSEPSESLTVRFSSIQAIVMGLNPNARPSDTNGVVTITFAIVGHGHLQLLSITLLKKDINTCRMLVNFEPLQKVILESAVAVEGGEASVRAQLIQAIWRDGAEFCALAAPRIRDLSDQWIATEPSDAIALMPGVARVASLRRGEQAPPLDQMLTSISNSVCRSLRRQHMSV